MAAILLPLQLFPTFGYNDERHFSRRRPHPGNHLPAARVGRTDVAGAFPLIYLLAQPAVTGRRSHYTWMESLAGIISEAIYFPLVMGA